MWEDIFARKYMYEKLTKCPNCTWCLPENASIFHDIYPKNIFPKFVEGGGHVPPAPSPTPMSNVAYRRRGGRYTAHLVDGRAVISTRRLPLDDQSSSTGANLRVWSRRSDQLNVNCIWPTICQRKLPARGWPPPSPFFPSVRAAVINDVRRRWWSSCSSANISNQTVIIIRLATPRIRRSQRIYFAFTLPTFQKSHASTKCRRSLRLSFHSIRGRWKCRTCKGKAEN